MTSRLRRTLGVLALTVGLASGPALMAAAITGGTADGEAHPNVAMIVFYDPDGRFRCSATLVSPTVILTAAHCTKGTLGKTVVTFNSVIAETPPSPLPVAADPTKGYTGHEKVPAGYVFGTASTHPSYSDFTDLANWNDVGVIVLDKAVAKKVARITPARIAAANYLDAFGQPVLNSTLFTSVGYGTEVRTLDSGPQKPTPM
ncbi:MAG TPA: trypsin-like serine protease [Dermatophilaceae bacterium]|nr:trypsin-like serine protease [Dermatophilaceae bacterium]